MTLAIQALDTHWRSAKPIPPQRLQGWVQALAAQDGDALAASAALQDGWVFIRHLPLQMRLRADAVDAEVGEAWRQSLAAALQHAVADAGGHAVVRYPHRHDALADLLYRSALGETVRQWAWQRMALLPRAGLGAAQALQHGTMALLREPQAVWPVLVRLLAGETACASLTALLHGWSAATWRQVLLASPRTRPYVRDSAAATTATAAEQAAAACLDIPDAASGWLSWARSRPQAVAARAEAVPALLAALTWPQWPVSQPQAASRVIGLHERIQPPRGSTPSWPPHAAVGSTAPPAVRPEQPTPPRHRAADAAPLPPLPLPVPGATGLPTRHGGLLFWLGQLPRLGIVAAEHDPPPALLLRALAHALGAPDDDPALAAFCGGNVPPGEIPAGFAASAAAHAQGLEQWLADAAPDLAPPRLDAVCRRAGQLHFRPGWIELRLPLSGVDTAVRRLGLDLDPGWLPWLGCVVSIHYDD